MKSFHCVEIKRWEDFMTLEVGPTVICPEHCLPESPAILIVGNNDNHCRYESSCMHASKGDSSSMSSSPEASRTELKEISDSDSSYAIEELQRLSLALRSALDNTANLSVVDKCADGYAQLGLFGDLCIQGKHHTSFDSSNKSIVTDLEQSVESLDSSLNVRVESLSDDVFELDSANRNQDRSVSNKDQKSKNASPEGIGGTDVNGSYNSVSYGFVKFGPSSEESSTSTSGSYYLPALFDSESEIDHREEFVNSQDSDHAMYKVVMDESVNTDDDCKQNDHSASSAEKGLANDWTSGEISSSQDSSHFMDSEQSESDGTNNQSHMPDDIEYESEHKHILSQNSEDTSVDIVSNLSLHKDRHDFAEANDYISISADTIAQNLKLSCSEISNAFTESDNATCNDTNLDNNPVIEQNNVNSISSHQRSNTNEKDKSFHVTNGSHGFAIGKRGTKYSNENVENNFKENESMMKKNLQISGSDGDSNYLLKPNNASGDGHAENIVDDLNNVPNSLIGVKHFNTTTLPDSASTIPDIEGSTKHKNEDSNVVVTTEYIFYQLKGLDSAQSFDSGSDFTSVDDQSSSAPTDSNTTDIVDSEIESECVDTIIETDAEDIDVMADAALCDQSISDIDGGELQVTIGEAAMCQENILAVHSNASIDVELENSEKKGVVESNATSEIDTDSKNYGEVLDTAIEVQGNALFEDDKFKSDTVDIPINNEVDFDVSCVDCKESKDDKTPENVPADANNKMEYICPVSSVSNLVDVTMDSTIETNMLSNGNIFDKNSAIKGHALKGSPPSIVIADATTSADNDTIELSSKEIDEAAHVNLEGEVDLDSQNVNLNALKHSDLDVNVMYTSTANNRNCDRLRAEETDNPRETIAIDAVTQKTDSGQQRDVDIDLNHSCVDTKLGMYEHLNASINNPDNSVKDPATIKDIIIVTTACTDVVSDRNTNTNMDAGIVIDTGISSIATRLGDIEVDRNSYIDADTDVLTDVGTKLSTTSFSDFDVDRNTDIDKDAHVATYESISTVCTDTGVDRDEVPEIDQTVGFDVDINTIILKCSDDTSRNIDTEIAADVATDEDIDTDTEHVRNTEPYIDAQAACDEAISTLNTVHSGHDPDRTCDMELNASIDTDVIMTWFDIDVISNSNTCVDEGFVPDVHDNADITTYSKVDTEKNEEAGMDTDVGIGACYNTVTCECTSIEPCKDGDMGLAADVYSDAHCAADTITFSDVNISRKEDKEINTGITSAINDRFIASASADSQSNIDANTDMDASANADLDIGNVTPTSLDVGINSDLDTDKDADIVTDTVCGMVTSICTDCHAVKSEDTGKDIDVPTYTDDKTITALSDVYGDANVNTERGAGAINDVCESTVCSTSSDVPADVSADRITVTPSIDVSIGSGIFANAESDIDRSADIEIDKDVTRDMVISRENECSNIYPENEMIYFTEEDVDHSTGVDICSGATSFANGDRNTDTGMDVFYSANADRALTTTGTDDETARNADTDMDNFDSINADCALTATDTDDATARNADTDVDVDVADDVAMNTAIIISSDVDSDNGGYREVKAGDTSNIDTSNVTISYADVDVDRNADTTIDSDDATDAEINNVTTICCDIDADTNEFEKNETDFASEEGINSVATTFANDDSEILADADINTNVAADVYISTVSDTCADVNARSNEDKCFGENVCTDVNIGTINASGRDTIVETEIDVSDDTDRDINIVATARSDIGNSPANADIVTYDVCVVNISNVTVASSVVDTDRNEYTGIDIAAASNVDITEGATRFANIDSEPNDNANKDKAAITGAAIVTNTLQDVDDFKGFTIHSDTNDMLDKRSEVFTGDSIDKATTETDEHESTGTTPERDLYINDATVHAEDLDMVNNASFDVEWTSRMVDHFDTVACTNASADIQARNDVSQNDCTALPSIETPSNIVGSDNIRNATAISEFISEADVHATVLVGSDENVTTGLDSNMINEVDAEEYFNGDECSDSDVTKDYYRSVETISDNAIGEDSTADYFADIHTLTKEDIYLDSTKDVDGGANKALSVDLCSETNQDTETPASFSNVYLQLLQESSGVKDKPTHGNVYLNDASAESNREPFLHLKTYDSAAFSDSGTSDVQPSIDNCNLNIDIIACNTSDELSITSQEMSICSSTRTKFNGKEDISTDISIDLEIAKNGGHNKPILAEVCKDAIKSPVLDSREGTINDKQKADTYFINNSADSSDGSKAGKRVDDGGYAENVNAIADRYKVGTDNDVGTSQQLLVKKSQNKHEKDIKLMSLAENKAVEMIKYHLDSGINLNPSTASPESPDSNLLDTYIKSALAVAIATLCADEPNELSGDKPTESYSTANEDDFDQNHSTNFQHQAEVIVEGIIKKVVSDARWKHSDCTYTNSIQPQPEKDNHFVQTLPTLKSSSSDGSICESTRKLTDIHLVSDVVSQDTDSNMSEGFLPVSCDLTNVIVDTNQGHVLKNPDNGVAETQSGIFEVCKISSSSSNGNGHVDERVPGEIIKLSLNGVRNGKNVLEMISEDEDLEEVQPDEVFGDSNNEIKHGSTDELKYEHNVMFSRRLIHKISEGDEFECEDWNEVANIGCDSVLKDKVDEGPSIYAEVIIQNPTDNDLSQLHQDQVVQPSQESAENTANRTDHCHLERFESPADDCNETSFFMDSGVGKCPSALTQHIARCSDTDDSEAKRSDSMLESELLKHKHKAFLEMRHDAQGDSVVNKSERMKHKNLEADLFHSKGISPSTIRRSKRRKLDCYKDNYMSKSLDNSCGATHNRQNENPLPRAQSLSKMFKSSITADLSRRTEYRKQSRAYQYSDTNEEYDQSLSSGDGSYAIYRSFDSDRDTSGELLDNQGLYNDHVEGIDSSYIHGDSYNAYHGSLDMLYDMKPDRYRTNGKSNKIRYASLQYLDSMEEYPDQRHEAKKVERSTGKSDNVKNNQYTGREFEIQNEETLAYERRKHAFESELVAMDDMLRYSMWTDEQSRQQMSRKPNSVCENSQEHKAEKITHAKKSIPQDNMCDYYPYDQRRSIDQTVMYDIDIDDTKPDQEQYDNQEQRHTYSTNINGMKSRISCSSYRARRESAETNDNGLKAGHRLIDPYALNDRVSHSLKTNSDHGSRQSHRGIFSENKYVNNVSRRPFISHHYNKRTQPQTDRNVKNYAYGSKPEMHEARKSGLGHHSRQNGSEKNQVNKNRYASDICSPSLDGGTSRRSPTCNQAYWHLDSVQKRGSHRHRQPEVARSTHTIMRIQEQRDSKKWKDGPLSLADTYGPMQNHNDTTPNSGPALSQSTNQLSGSVASLSNRQAPASSPSRQSTLQKQTSLQSVQSDINGSQRDEEGIKFERLKNLSEDDLLAKIHEIIGHFEKLEEYHRGDGMRIQKMLGDMYWDYTHMREMVGDCMADHGYAAVSMTMLKTLNSIGIFKNDDVWFPTYYTYNTMWNFTDASSKLAKALSEHDAVRLLTLNCGHKPYINAIHSKNVYYVIKASLSILHNIARNSGMKHLFDENKTSETIMPFIESEDEMLKILATLTISNIVDEEENKTLIAETGTIHCIINWIEKALGLPRRRYKGFTPQELTEGLNKLAVNDNNKMRIIEEGALPLFLRMLQHDDVREQSSAARVIWTLSFDKDVRQKINEHQDLIAQLQKLTESTNKSLQTNTQGALWVIRGDNDVTKESRPKSAKSKTHVFLSYSWSDKEAVLALRDRLRAEGYAIWIDIEKMGGSTLEAMATAVENSAVVLICMSEKYKQSPNCRTEAEYTFQLRKDYIPLMLQKRYRPDGWLGLILGAKLYFDFSGKYPFDKSFQGLLKELRGRGKVTPDQTPGENNDHTDAAFVHSAPLTSHPTAGTPVHHQMLSSSVILNMGQEELVKWLRNIKLTECIPAFMEFDGKLLMQLKHMRAEAPEFFYQCLEKRMNMSLIEILKFTRALEELH